MTEVIHTTFKSKWVAHLVAVFYTPYTIGDMLVRKVGNRYQIIEKTP